MGAGAQTGLQEIHAETNRRAHHQKSMHAIPSFKARVKNADGLEYTIYFAALFSKKPDAVPIIFSHGWPGCLFEFWELLLNVSKQYTPEELP